MADNLINNRILQIINSTMDGLTLRQKTTANNIANVDTPGYKAQRIEFEAELKRAIESGANTDLQINATHTHHYGHSTDTGTNLKPILQSPNDHRNDANNVDVDIEMTTLAETSLRYQAMSQLASKKISLLKAVIKTR